MSIKLSKLPFSIDSLEPFISSETIYFHFEKHHAGYVNTLNKLIEGSAYDRLGLSEIMLISAKIPGDKKIFKNAAQVWNHDFYWKCLKNPAPACPKTVAQYLNECFGSENSFTQSFVKAGTEHFGSGYVWLIKNEIGLLEIITTSNAKNPLALGQIPLLCCDLWEHAYYLDRQNDRTTYLDQFIQILNWEFVEHNLDQINKKRVSFSPEHNHTKENTL
jgi:Fe-Mn family superoxide dismutase